MSSRIVPKGEVAQILPSRKLFFAEILRERSRADRSGAALCVAVLDLEQLNRDGRSSADALAVVSSRVRGTDVVAWLGPRLLGILLPDTLPPGALELIGDLDRRLGRRASLSSWMVYAHPHPSNGVASSVPRVQPREKDVDGRHGRNGHGRNGSTNGHTKARGTGAVAVDGSTTRIASKSGVGTSTDALAVASLREMLLQPLPPLSRLRDIVGAAAGLVLLSPFMLAVAIAVKLSSPGPVIYRAQRCGLGGRRFTFYKFRTMYAGQDCRRQELMRFNEQTGPVFKMACDPRVTPVGRFLRKTSIDELPQLWNVLKGDMSLVGPRPPIPEEAMQYAPWQIRRLEVPGGLTCFWQVGGRSHVKFEDWVRMDLRYARERSMWLDLKLILRTFPAVLTCRGAH